MTGGHAFDEALDAAVSNWSGSATLDAHWEASARPCPPSPQARHKGKFARAPDAPPPVKWKHVDVRMTVEMKQRLHARARADGVSQRALVMAALKEYL
jgi:hypothetical protein